MRTQALFPLALLLSTLLSAQVKSEDDPFNDLIRQYETAQTKWRDSHDAFMAGLLQANTCSPDFRSSILALQSEMKSVFQVRREYYAAWEKMMASRITREQTNFQRLPSQVARLQKDADRAKALADDARRRLRELTTIRNTTNDDVVQALREVIETTDKEEQETRATLAMLDKERNEIRSQSEGDAKTLRMIAARIVSVRTEEHLWENLYQTRLNRGRLQCKDGFK